MQILGNMQTGTPLVAQGLRKRFGRTLALDGVSFEIGPGEVFAYLGPNGAGKTTTIRLLMGMLRPSAGRALVFGLDAWADAVAVHRIVGYVPGEPSVYGRLTGHQHIAYVGHLRGRNDRARALALAERLDLDLDRHARTLSRGNRQKLALVLAVMSEPRLLILDEPTSGLDPLVQHEVHALLREHTRDGGSVLLSSHVLGEVQRVADRIAVVKQGKLVAVERLDELSARSLHRVHASFDTDVDPSDFATVPGVIDVKVTDRKLSCSAPQSALDPLLKRISAHHVVDFECAEAELEDLFMGYYGGETHADERPHEVTV